MPDTFQWLRPLLYACLTPEAAHRLAVMALRHRLVPARRIAPSTALALSAFGLSFPNPVGLAAGFDKNATAIDGALAQGFGFVEAGTVTPKPQSGNPRPRLFRLVEDEAVINRLGFNNDGLDHFVRHFTQRNRARGIAGANIGKNKDSSDAVQDYVTGMRAVYPHADYIAVNVSSPNTVGLRALQERGALEELLAALGRTRDESMLVYNRRVPLLLKIAPDLDAVQKESIAEIVLASGIDGLIISNTTVSRPSNLRSPNRQEQGGLSGRPLFALSTEMLKEFYRLTGGKLPLIGVGGIASAQDAYLKIRAGATLVQCYTAMVYQGFAVIPRIVEGLDALLQRDGFTHIHQAIGIDAA